MVYRIGILYFEVLFFSYFFFWNTWLTDFVCGLSPEYNLHHGEEQTGSKWGQTLNIECIRYRGFEWFHSIFNNIDCIRYPNFHSIFQYRERNRIPFDISVDIYRMITSSKPFDIKLYSISTTNIGSSR